MDQNAVEERLQQCGLDDREARVYLTLLTRGVAKASDVARQAGVSRMDAYNTLKRLQGRGLVEATVEKPMRFIPQPLAEALALLTSEKEQQIQLIQDSAEVLSEYVKAHHVAQVAEQRFRIIKGRRAIQQQLFRQIREAQRYIKLITAQEEFIRFKAAGGFKLLERRVAEGVEVQFISNLNHANQAQAEAASERFPLRHREVPASNLLITDGTDVNYSIAIDDQRASSGVEDVALWMNSPDYIAIQELFFDTLWERAVPVDRQLTELKTGRQVEPLQFFLGPGSLYERLKRLIRQRQEGLVSGNAGSPSYALEGFGLDGAELLQVIGYRIGQEIAHDLVSDTRPALWQELRRVWEELGMGMLSVQDDAELYFTVQEPFTCRDAPLLGQPVCALDEGMLQGIIETKLGLLCQVHETSCTATGDAVCRYEVALTAA